MVFPRNLRVCSPFSRRQQVTNLTYGISNPKFPKKLKHFGVPAAVLSRKPCASEDVTTSITGCRIFPFADLQR
jgi:hypothetical protein